MKDENEKSTKRKSVLIRIIAVMLIVGTIGVTYSFFSYTRTGGQNTVSVGRISFATNQTETVNLTNAFPISRSAAPTATANVDDVVITISGDTDYSGGVEYLVTATAVTNTVNDKTLPISIIVTPSGSLGTSNDNYYTARSSANASIYKQEAGNTLENDGRILVGYIAPNTTPGTASGINGTITIRAFLDSDLIAISDTYNDGNTPTDEKGTPVSFGEGKTVFTTTEWNSLSSTGVSFKVSIEAHEGLWVKQATTMTLASTSGMILPEASETIAITTTGTGSITCQSSDTSVATCSVTDSNLTINGVALGDAVVTVNQAEGALTSATSTTYNVIEPICKRVTEVSQLHTETCNYACGQDYSSGATITYGNALALGTNTLTAGDAFDCKVSTTGGYTERFYYVSPYYDTLNETFDNTYATLIYYSNTKNNNGTIVATSTEGTAYYSNSENWHGPATALTALPTTSMWNNITLKETLRKIWSCGDASCEIVSDKTYQNPAHLGGSNTITPNPFSYAGYAARLLTIQEIKESTCVTSNEIDLILSGTLKQCKFLFEGTKYASDNNTYGPWLENPMQDGNSLIYYLDGSGRNVYNASSGSNNYGVRPTIDVPIDRILK